MKKQTLKNVRALQPPLFEILMKHRGQWHVADVAAAPVVFLLGRDGKTAYADGFDGESLSPCFAWAKPTLAGLKNEYDALMRTAAPLMHQFIQSRSVFVVYEEGDNETVFNYFDNAARKGVTSAGSCSQVISTDGIFSVIQFNAAQYEPDICLLAHEISHHADRVPLYVADKPNFVKMSFSDTPLFKNALAYEIVANPTLGFAAQIDEMMRQKIRDKVYGDTAYDAEMFARLNVCYIDDPSWFKKHHTVLGNLLERVAAHVVALKTRPNVFDAYRGAVLKCYGEILSENGAEQPLKRLAALKASPYLKGEHADWIHEAGLDTALPEGVLRERLNRHLLGRAKASLIAAIRRFRQQDNRLEHRFRHNHQYILCNRHRLYQQELSLSLPPIPFRVKEYRHHD